MVTILLIVPISLEKKMMTTRRRRKRRRRRRKHMVRHTLAWSGTPMMRLLTPIV
jgi:hypothetical protein